MNSKHTRKSFLKVMGLGAVGLTFPTFGCSQLAKPHSSTKNITIFKKENGYAAFPRLLQLPNGNLFSEFQVRPMASHIDPRGDIIRMISEDGGNTWKQTEEKIYNPDFKSSSGKMVDANAYGWRYVQPSRREELEARGIEVRDSPDGRIAYAYGCYKRTSTDGGNTWNQTELEVPSEALIMTYLGPCTYLRVNDNVILRAVYGRPKANVHFYESWLLRSEDNGESWEFLTIGRDPNEEIGFGETALAQAPNGDIIAMMRSQPPRKWKYLYSVRSSDRGKTWSEPVNTGMYGHPASVISLKNGHMLCTYGYREDPMGIRAVFSYDNGETWDTDNIRILRDDGAGGRGDLGYPISVQREDGKIFTIYYMTTEEGVTHIAGTIWEE